MLFCSLKIEWSIKWMEIWAENWFLWIFPYFESSYFFLVFQKAYFFHNRGGGLLAKIFTLGQNKRWENVTSVMTRTWFEHTTFCTGVRRATVAPRLHVERQVWDVMSLCLCTYGTHNYPTTHNYTTTNNYFTCGCVYVCVYVFCFRNYLYFKSDKIFSSSKFSINHHQQDQCRCCHAWLAQSVEHQTLKLGVVGSSPTLGEAFLHYGYG